MKLGILQTWVRFPVRPFFLVAIFCSFFFRGGKRQRRGFFFGNYLLTCYLAYAHTHTHHFSSSRNFGDHIEAHNVCYIHAKSLYSVLMVSRKRRKLFAAPENQSFYWATVSLRFSLSTWKVCTLTFVWFLLIRAVAVHLDSRFEVIFCYLTGIVRC